MNFAKWTNVRRWPIAFHGPIGVDIGSHTIKAVQVRGSGGDTCIVASATLPRAGEAEPIGEIAARLRNVLHRQNFHGRDVVLAAPPKRLECDLLELPPRSSGAPLETLARVELGQLASMASAPFEMACWDIPTFERAAAGTSLMAVALRHADAETLVDQFDAQGLHVRAIDAAACACSRVSGVDPDERAMTAMVDLGWTGFRLVLIGNGIVTYQRLLSDAGLGAIHHEIATRLGVPGDVAQFAVGTIGISASKDMPESNEIDPGEAIRIRTIIARHVESLVTELKAAFAFAAHQFSALPLKRLIIGGGGAAIPGLTRSVAERIAIPTETWNSAMSRGSSEPGSMLATGLALYQED